MAYAPDVLREAVEEADLLSHSGGRMEEVAEVCRLAHEALHAGGGQIDDEACKILHPSRWHRLGIE